MEEQDRASKTKGLKKSRPLSAFKCAGWPKILQSEGFVWVGRSGPGGSPVIKLHGANDHLVNENVDSRWVVDGSAERMRMELTESRVRREALQQLVRRRGWGLATLTRSSTKLPEMEKTLTAHPMARDVGSRRSRPLSKRLRLHQGSCALGCFDEFNCTRRAPASPGLHLQLLVSAVLSIVRVVGSSQLLRTR